MPPGRPPAMSDVAARAGVSHQTVSRVLNDHPSVRAETRDRVLAAIAELGYRRNSAARALVTARTTTVGVLTSGSTHFGPASMVQAIEIALRREGYYVTTASLDSLDRASAAQALERLVDQGVEGVVAVAPIEDVARVIDDLRPSCPVVVAAARHDLPADVVARYVYADQQLGARVATEHLLGLGHRHLLHLAGPAGWFDARERTAAFLETAEAAGARAEVLEAADWSAARGYELGKEVAPRVLAGEGPTAFFTGNDLMAIGLVRGLWESGVRVPDDVSVVGYDDIEGSAYLVPALTTVRQPFEAVGEAAVRALLAAWQPASSREPQVAVMPPELVVRGSTAPPRR